MVILTHKMDENIFGIIFILTAAKNHNNNFADSPLGPDYYSSSNASLTAFSNQHCYSIIKKSEKCLIMYIEAFGHDRQNIVQ